MISCFRSGHGSVYHVAVHTVTTFTYQVRGELVATWALTCRATTPINAAQGQAYLNAIDALVEPRIDGSGGLQLVGVTVLEPVVKGGPLVPAPVKALVLIGVETNVSEAVWQAILDRINTQLPGARTIRFQRDTLTDAQVDARLY